MKSNPAMPGGLVEEYADAVERLMVFDRVGFFCAFGGPGFVPPPGVRDRNLHQWAADQ